MRSAPGGGTTPGAAASPVGLDRWDLRHLLLSIEERPRGARDAADLEGVVARAVAALAALPPPPPIGVPPASTAPLLVEGLPLWVLETNGWLVAAPDGECIVVDVPPSPGRLVERIDALGLRLTAVVLTHAHADHAGGAAALLRALALRVPVYVHPGDRNLALHPEAGGVLARLAGEVAPVPRHLLEPFDGGTELSVGGVAVRALPAPGHSAGSACVLIEGAAAPLVFTGDALFAGHTGRCDLAGGSRSTADASLRDVLAPLPDATLVLPGHGGITTIGAERGSWLASAPSAA